MSHPAATTLPLRLAPARTADLETIIRINNQHSPRRWHTLSKKNFGRQFPGCIFMVMYEQDEIVAFLIVKQNTIIRIAPDDNWLKQGGSLPDSESLLEQVTNYLSEPLWLDSF